MRTREDYRRLAAECLALAVQVADPHQKDMLLRMADVWKELAERTEPENKQVT